MKILITLFTLISSTAFAALPDVSPVMVGGETDLDACGGSGLVTVSTVLFNKDKKGYMNFDKVEATQMVYFCDSQEVDGEIFIGVVVQPEKNGKVDCGVSGVIEKRQPYSGKCKSGWVNKKYLELIAG